jgi:hypothetical protein
MGLFNSIVRGFGHKVGSSIATSVINGVQSNNVVSSSSELECYSKLGYQEGDVEIMYDKGSHWNRQYVKWYMWPASIFNGLFFITPLFYISDLYNVFVKKHKMYFYDLKWNTYKVSDRRSKTGIREIKNLDMVLSKTIDNKPYLRTKIETILQFLLVSWFPLTILIYNLTK